MDKIKQTSPDKEKGKLLQYCLGDCLSIDCKNSFYLAVVISEIFNAYYDFTLIEFYNTNKPQLTDFINGKFFGTHLGSRDDLTYAVDKRMIKCKYIDNNNDIDKIGNVKLISGLAKASYSYFDNIKELLNYYLEEIPIRIEKSKNAEKFPELAFVSKHLVDMKLIIK